jgi:hypothetical protein
MKLPFLGVYQPIINPFFEAIFKKIRTRNGTILIPANDFKNNFMPYQDKQYVNKHKYHTQYERLGREREGEFCGGEIRG